MAQARLSFARIIRSPWTNVVLLSPLLPSMDPLDRMELAAFLISSAASLAAALGLYALLSALMSPEDARRGVFYFLVYPTAFFLIQVYTEALFLALVTWCLTMI